MAHVDLPQVEYVGRLYFGP